MDSHDSRDSRLGRRGVIALGAGAAALPLLGRGARAQGSVPALSGRAVNLGVIDAAGNLALTQKVFDAYGSAHADRVSRFAISRAPAPEVAGKIRAMQRANRIDVDIVIGGNDVLAAGMELDLWQNIGALNDPALNPDTLYDTGARKQADLARGFGVLINYTPQGPFIQYAPARVANPPRSLQQLLDYAKSNPNRVFYARPANSGVGRTFVMAVPYILGDSDPKDPEKGWSKTWAYLEELNKYIEYYPAGTGAMMREFAQGTRDVMPSTMGWDINPRVLGIVPKEAEVVPIENFRFVSDGHYICIPKGLPQDRLAAALDFIRFLMTPEQQAVTYDEGYFYPGPARKGVTLEMAPESSQRAMREFGRPIYDELMRTTPVETPLEPKPMVAAFRIWDERIGAQKTR
jgi:putative spermidine/putrescine transport system substrate-binding protein